MSSMSDTSPGGVSGGPWRRGGGRCGMAGWHPVEILAVVLGFMVYWPIGLGLIVWKMAQKRGFGPGGDWFGHWRETVRGFGPKSGTGFGASGFGLPGGGFADRTGNVAFDEWRRAEIERLEAERRKLEEAQREFAEFAAEARKVRDREEFERFMNARARPQG